jgi:hypothetical protein
MKRLNWDWTGHNEPRWGRWGKPVVDPSSAFLTSSMDAVTVVSTVAVDRIVRTVK